MMNDFFTLMTGLMYVGRLANKDSSPNPKGETRQRMVQDSIEDANYLINEVNEYLRTHNKSY